MVGDVTTEDDGEPGATVEPPPPHAAATSAISALRAKALRMGSGYGPSVVLGPLFSTQALTVPRRAASLRAIMPARPTANSAITAMARILHRLDTP